MTEESDRDFMTAAAYGRSLRGVGVNLLVREVAPVVDFMTGILGVEAVYANRDFAVLRHGGQDWMLHADHTYHANPLLALTGDGALRGAGVELRLYDIDPDQAEARARAAGHTVLQASADKPHGLRECFLVDPAGYVWAPSTTRARFSRPWASPTSVSAPDEQVESRRLGGSPRSKHPRASTAGRASFREGSRPVAVTGDALAVETSVGTRSPRKGPGRCPTVGHRPRQLLGPKPE